MATSVTVRHATNGFPRLNRIHTQQPANGDQNQNYRNGLLRICVTVTPQTQEMIKRLEKALKTDRIGVVRYIAQAVHRGEVTREDIRFFAELLNRDYLAQLLEAPLGAKTAKPEDSDFAGARFNWEEKVDLIFKAASMDTYNKFDRSKIFRVLVMLFAVKKKVTKLYFDNMNIERPRFS
jgi:hypothetical protein